MEMFLGVFTAEWEQRRAAFLQERLIGKSPVADEELRRRRGTVVADAFGGHGSGRRVDHSFGSYAGRGVQSACAFGRVRKYRSMAKRFVALASGSQPAVVKIVSYGGGTRLGAMVSYVSRGGALALENQLGDQLKGRNAVHAISGDWADLMGNRTESRDIGLFRLDVGGGPTEATTVNDWARDRLKSGFGDRSFAFAVTSEAEGRFRIEGVVVLRAGDGERLTADAKATRIVQARMADANTNENADLKFRFTGYGNGVEYGASKLRNLVKKHSGAVNNESGDPIEDADKAGDLVSRKWRRQLHSRKPRDVMHLIVSARAGTDVEAFREAVRAFLAAEFGEHRYVFTVHDPSQDPKSVQEGGKRPHVHGHAIVVMRSDHGDRVETTIASFRHWRGEFAEHARAAGIKMEMTDRREKAAAPAFTRNQVRPVSHTGRTEHEGTSDVAQQRYDGKRANAPNIARSDQTHGYTQDVKREWRRLTGVKYDQQIRAFAHSQIYRLETAKIDIQLSGLSERSAKNSGSQFKTQLVKLTKLSEIADMNAMTRPEFDAYEKRVETALSQAERVMPDNERTKFEEIASAARAHVDVRRQLIEQTLQSDDRKPEEVERHRPDDDANQRWQEAIERHGLKATEAANEALLSLEHFREAIELVDAGEIKADKAALQASLQFELAKAATLGASGNTLIREIGEVDDELRMAIQAAERSRQRPSPASENLSGRPAEQPVAYEEVARSLTVAPDQELAGSDAARHALRSDATRPSGDTTRSDPAKQHIPRLEELQREADERVERDDR